MNEPSTDIALIKQDVGYIRNEVKGIRDQISNSYVTKSEFQALKARVDLFHRTTAYFLIIVGVALVGAALRLLLK